MTNISYELAKELKEAGFPVRRANINDVVIVFYDTNGKIVGGNATHLFKDRIDFFVPTLSELIEWCHPFSPDEFYFGTHLDYWEATWRNHSAREEDDLDITCKGQTPEEAVARLGIAIHKK